MICCNKLYRYSYLHTISSYNNISPPSKTIFPLLQQENRYYFRQVGRHLLLYILDNCIYIVIFIAGLQYVSLTISEILCCITSSTFSHKYDFRMKMVRPTNNKYDELTPSLQSVVVLYA